MTTQQQCCEKCRHHGDCSHTIHAHPELACPCHRTEVCKCGKIGEHAGSMEDHPEAIVNFVKEHARPEQEWEKEFVYKFVAAPSSQKHGYLSSEVRHERVLDFIRSLLEKQREELMVHAIYDRNGDTFKVYLEGHEVPPAYEAGRAAAYKEIAEKVEKLIEAVDLQTPDNFLRSMYAIKIGGYRDVIDLLTSNEPPTP